MRVLSVVIPALNERENIARVLASVPVSRLSQGGWATEIVVVDNASTDGTGALAAELGATVVLERNRGYGNAYKAGFRQARGEIIATGDADLTYPLDTLPELLAALDQHGADFMTTNRLLRSNRQAMKPSHSVGNHALSLVSRALFANPFRDSQSGMWVFKRAVWDQLDVRSSGMAFSQEIKNEAYRRGLRCVEVPIEYRPRGGTVKLNAMQDGWANLRQLLEHRRRPAGPAVSAPPPHLATPHLAPAHPATAYPAFPATARPAPASIDLRTTAGREVMTALDD